ncbi:hypothetical protein [Streptacidiphilus cavernicola]|uniref:Transposase n=1 Tax=Streptacidiphilus cavernicola TaxID=3342716 RepID=A0ABV6VPP4_9ACTN
MDVDQVADELYGLLPAQFTAARDAAAAQARKDGEPDAAARIKALRRPTLGAWLADLLVREHPDEVRALLELGAGLRAAQDALDGPELRELTARRRSVVSALSRQAGQAATRAGLSVGEGPRQDLEDHLQAVLADQELADAFATGRLSSTRGAAASGSAALSASAPTRSPGAARSPAATSSPAAPDPAAERAAARRQAEADRRAEARRRRAEAEQDAKQAQAAAVAARRALDRATAQRERLRRSIADLTARLQQARDEERKAATAVRSARSRVETTDRAARKASGLARDAAEHLQYLGQKAA